MTINPGRGGVAPEHKWAAPTLRVSPFNETAQHILRQHNSCASHIWNFLSWDERERRSDFPNLWSEAKRARNQNMSRWTQSKYERIVQERRFVQDEKEPLGRICNGFSSPVEPPKPRTPTSGICKPPPVVMGSLKKHLWPDCQHSSRLWEKKSTKKKKNLRSQAATASLACTKGTEIIIRRSYDNDIWMTKWTKATRERAGALNGPEPPSATKQHESKHSIRRRQTEQTLKWAALCRVSTVLKQQRRWIHIRTKKKQQPHWLFIRFASWQRGQQMQMHSVQKKHARHFFFLIFFARITAVKTSYREFRRGSVTAQKRHLDSAQLIYNRHH